MKIPVFRRSALLALLLACLPLPAGAHANRGESVPEPGSRLDAPPREVSVHFTEPPTGDATFQVLDGCERDLVESIDILNGTITAQLSEGQPGRWVVRWQVISAVDGHPTKDQMTFQVEGDADCEAEVATPTVAATEEPDPEDGGSSPVVPILLTSVAIVGLAVVGRFVFK